MTTISKIAKWMLRINVISFLTIMLAYELELFECLNRHPMRVGALAMTLAVLTAVWLFAEITLIENKEKLWKKK